MKIKRFTLLSLPALAIVAGVIAFANPKTPHYSPQNIGEVTSNSAEGYLQYMRDVKANRTTGEVDVADVFAARKQANLLPKSKAALNINWAPIGPDNIGGRTRSLIVDRNDSKHIYAGAVAGGVFESFDGASTWQPYDPSFSVSKISTMTQATDGAVYVGTGGHFESPTNFTTRGTFFVGTGIYKLTGNGNFKSVIAPSIGNSVGVDYGTIGRITTSPTDPLKLYVAMNNGFRILQLDANGDVLTSTDPIGYNGKCNVVEVSKSGKVLVAYEGRIYVSQANDANFVETTPTPPYPGMSFARIETAIAPSDDKIMYAGATVGNPGSSGLGRNCLAGIYRSKDSGLTWEIINQGGANVDDLYNQAPGLPCQGWWDNVIAVYPDDPGKIIVGGVRLFRWEQSSIDPAVSNGSWNQIDILFDFLADGSPVQSYVHADKHAVVWDPNNSDVAYIVTDGGVTKTTDFNDENPTFKVHNYGYGVTQYYDIGVNSHGVVLAGAQDNGTQALGLRNTGNLAGYDVLGNDGFDCELSNIDSSLGFATSQNNRLARIQGIGTTPGNSNFSSANIVSNNSWLGNICAAGDCSPVFYTATTLWESFDHIGSTDSVEMVKELLTLPPISMGTLFKFKGNNNDYPQEATLAADKYPLDTISGTSSAMDTLLLKNATQIVYNFDTIKVDTVNKSIVINRRGGVPVVNLNYVLGKNMEYVNGILGLSTVLTDSLISLKVDTFKFGPETGDIYLIVEKAFINFRYKLKFQDKVQSIYASANWAGRGGSGVDRNQRNIFISRDLLKGISNVKWFMIGGANSTPSQIQGTILTMKFTSDGNHLYVGTTSGNLYRISDIDNVASYLAASESSNLLDIVNGVMVGKCHEIGRFGSQAVTAIDVDPNNDDNVVVALGNYGNASHIRRTTIGTTAMSSSGTFDVIDGTGANALPRAPAYSVLIDKNDHNRVLIGTDIGVFGTDNAFDPNASAVSWTEENGGMGRVPAFDLQQMRLDYTKAVNDGKVYVGTHGRGVYATDIFVGLNDRGNEQAEEKSFKGSFNFYPNPVTTNATLSFKLTDAVNDVNIQIFNIRGQMVKNMSASPSNGKNEVKLNLQDLNNGTYLIRAIHNGKVASTKFIKH